MVENDIQTKLTNKNSTVLFPYPQIKVSVTKCSIGSSSLTALLLLHFICTMGKYSKKNRFHN